MKFNIYGFNQEKLVTNYNTLNGNDIIVLRVLVDMLPRMTRRIEEDGIVYKQVTYELLLQDVPFVTQSESTLKKIVKKLIDAGLIERKIVNKNGKFTYFRETELLKDLVYIADDKSEISSCTTVKEAVVESEDTNLQDRVEYIQQVLNTRASRAIKEELKRFESQFEFFDYYDNFILPDRQVGKKNTCSYMLKNLKMYFSGNLT